MTINGIPLNDAESQNVFWVDLPNLVDGTQDIQVQRGVGTTLYGGSAIDQPYHDATVSIHALYGYYATAPFCTKICWIW